MDPRLRRLRLLQGGIDSGENRRWLRSSRDISRRPYFLVSAGAHGVGELMALGQEELLEGEGLRVAGAGAGEGVVGLGEQDGGW